MRYRLTAISVVVVALAAASLVFVLNRSDSPSSELTQPDLFPEGGLGLVGAFTATAEAGGAALDPTALAQPTSTSSALLSTPAPTDSTASAATVASSPVLSLSSDSAQTGDQLTVEISGAVPGEAFEISVAGIAIEVSSATADATGSLKIEITVPAGASGESAELVALGSISGANSTMISISNGSASVAVNPEQPEPGESLTVSAEGFEPGEAVTVSVAGEEVGSGIAGQDGSFSMTTGLPELPESESTMQTLSVEGENGSAASAEFIPPVQVGGSGPTGNGGQTAGVTDGGSEQPPITDGQPDSTGGTDDGFLPTWVYIVIGAMIGWIGILTVWVYRLDRDRESQITFLRGVISDLASNNRAELGSESGEDEISATDERRVA